MLPLPNPELFWGAAATGQKGPLSQGKLFAKYGPGIPLNAEFKILTWECEVPSSAGKPPRGTGDNIASALPLLRQARPGMSVIFTCEVAGPDKKTRIITGTYKL